ETRHAILNAARDEVARLRGIAVVIAQGVADGLGHHGLCREMHHDVDPVLAQHSAYQCHVAGVALHDLAVQHSVSLSRGKIVQYDDARRAFLQAEQGVAAYVACASGDKDAGTVHSRFLLPVYGPGAWEMPRASAARFCMKTGCSCACAALAGSAGSLIAFSRRCRSIQRVMMRTRRRRCVCRT